MGRGSRKWLKYRCVLNWTAGLKEGPRSAHHRLMDLDNMVKVLEALQQLDIPKVGLAIQHRMQMLKLGARADLPKPPSKFNSTDAHRSQTRAHRPRFGDGGVVILNLNRAVTIRIPSKEKRRRPGSTSRGVCSRRAGRQTNRNHARTCIIAKVGGLDMCCVGSRDLGRAAGMDERIGSHGARKWPGTHRQ